MSAAQISGLSDSGKIIGGADWCIRIELERTGFGHTGQDRYGMERDGEGWAREESHPRNRGEWDYDTEQSTY